MRCFTAILAATLATAVSMAGCSKRTSPSNDAPASSASGTLSAPSGSPAATASSRQAPKPYTGPVGTIRGTVRVSGDAPPVLENVLRNIPDECAGARSVYGTLFRRGSNGEAADVLVTATDYQHVIPPASDHVEVIGKDCAWNTRTVGMTMGQHLQVVAKDAKGYVPNLMGLPTPANMIPVPGGAPARLKPNRPGRHGFNDLAHLFAYADIFVVKFATLDVTGTDGKFEIAGIPAGPATVSALLPAAMLVGQRRVTVKANETVTVDFELKFDEAKYQKLRQETPASQASASTAPAPSAK